MADDAPTRTAALVALDWGTTTFRAWLLDDAGSVLDRIRSGDGALTVSERADSSGARAAAFEATLTRLCRRWLDEYPDVPVLCAGMAGSNHGWTEAGYLDVPVALGRLADHLTEVPVAGTSVSPDPSNPTGSTGTTARSVHIVPGLRANGPDPDVMRGEEVQLVGALAAAADRPGTVVLPGTHSKWVRLDGDRVTGFTTAMTGELYGLLMRDSILARLATGPAGPDDSAAYLRGIEAEAAHGDERGLPALLFTARTLVMAGRLDPTDVADYVSGVLIGAEVRHALRSTPADVVALCGSRSTVARYRLALERGGASVRVVGEDAAAHGLWRVALDAGLVAPAPSGPTQEAAPTRTTPTTATPTTASSTTEEQLT